MLVAFTREPRHATLRSDRASGTDVDADHLGLLRDHPPPHFHAFYGESRAFVAIATGEVVEGHLPAVARWLVREWTFAHRQELVDNWERARAGLPLERIAGLDND